MNIKIDIDVCCQNCGELSEIDYQLTRETVGRSETEREHTGILLVDVICHKCRQLTRTRVKNKQ